MCKGITRRIVYLFLLYILHSNVFAHGGVFLEDDLCVIQIGFFKAHFTIYQPEIAGNKEFCEDIPNLGSSLFVLDYLHDSLKRLPVDFRIIQNPTNLERSTTWQDIDTLNNLDQHTVFYQSDIIAHNGILQADYTFTKTGHYVGIITTQQPGLDKTYRAVFPFKVGIRNHSYLPLFLALLALLELAYLYSNGVLQRWYTKYKTRQ